MDILAASAQALAHSRMFDRISDHCCDSASGPQLMGPPQKADDAQSPAPVPPADDMVDVDPFAQAFAELQAIIERLADVSSGAGAQDALSDLKNFIDSNTGAQFAGGVLSEISDLVDSVLHTLEENPEALGNFVSFNFDFQFSHKSLQTDRSSLEATSFSFDFSLVSENTSFDAHLDFREKTLQTPGAFQSLTSESADISVTTNNLDLESNPVLEGFIDIANRLLGSASPFAAPVAPDPQAAPPPAENAENSPVPVPPAALRSQLFNLSQNSDVRTRAMELLDALFARIAEQRDAFAAEAA